MQRQKSGEAHYLRRFVSRVTSMSRTARLRRQFGEIEQRSLELPRSYRTQLAELIQRECTNVEQADLATYGSQTEGEVTTGGLDVGFDRARSENVQVRMRGIAVWLALVYHETQRDRAAADSDELHRMLLRLMRELKVFASSDDTDGNPA
jgi:hypothetical protein